MILVTGASGSNGSELLRRLSGAGVRVRAMTRKGRGRTLPCVEFIAGDFDNPRSIRRALAGVERAFLVTNSSERTETQQLGFVAAARETGVRHIVYISQLHADKESPVRFLRYHGIVEEAIADSGIPFTILRPNLYMQGLLAFRASIVSEGRFFAPMREARVSMVDVRDIAAVALAALTGSGHEGKTYDLTGPETLTHSELATQFTEALGRPVAFHDVAEDAMREVLLSWHMPSWQVEGQLEIYAHYRRSKATGVSTAIQEVTGRPPCTFRDFARDYRRALSR